MSSSQLQKIKGTWLKLYESESTNGSKTNMFDWVEFILISDIFSFTKCLYISITAYYLLISRQ